MKDFNEAIKMGEISRNMSMSINYNGVDERGQAIMKARRLYNQMPKEKKIKL